MTVLGPPLTASVSFPACQLENQLHTLVLLQNLTATRHRQTFLEKDCFSSDEGLQCHCPGSN